MTHAKTMIAFLMLSPLRGSAPRSLDLPHQSLERVACFAYVADARKGDKDKSSGGAPARLIAQAAQ